MLLTLVKYGAVVLVVFSLYKILKYFQGLPVKYHVHEFGIVLITGASSGIGQHTANYLATRYPNLIILAGVRKDCDAANIRELQLKNLRPILIDVASETSCLSAVATIEKISKDERVHMIALVNNAGVARRYPAELHNIGDAKKIFETNFWGAFYLTQLLIPKLRESQGRIINISSIAEFTGTPMNSVYVASKAAMGGWSDALRREVAHFGISVSVIQPAYIKSAIFTTAKEAMTQLMPEQSTPGILCDGQVNTPILLARYPQYFSTEALDRLDAEIRTDASEPTIVSKAIEHSLCSLFPQTRYAVGKVAGVTAETCSWIRWAMTDRGADRIMTPVP